GGRPAPSNHRGDPDATNPGPERRSAHATTALQFYHRSAAWRAPDRKHPNSTRRIQAAREGRSGEREARRFRSRALSGEPSRSSSRLGTAGRRSREASRPSLDLSRHEGRKMRARKRSRRALGEPPERDRLGNERAGKPKQATAPAKARRARTIRGSGSRRRDRAAGQAATAHHRFENWNDRRAAAKPYFFRSLTRESRVRNLPSRSASS